jgi:hypothetical protein
MSHRLSRTAAVLVMALAVTVAAPSAASALPAPVAAGDSAANIPLNAAGKRVVMRWVARTTGTMRALHLRIEAAGASCRLTGRTGYGLGNGGSWRVTTHPVLPDGRPDTTRTLSSYETRPCQAAVSVVDVVQGVARIPMTLAVVKGAEYATVVRNTDSQPSLNYTSTNFLYTSTGIVGANGRNERSRYAADAHYGLDPRELVGFSRDAGLTWSLPGGPYGLPGGRNFLPTYLQEFADGKVAGQPYYYTAAASTADRTMVFQNVKSDWTIRELGAWSLREGSGTLTLTVDGTQRARVWVSGAGMLRAAIPAVTVTAGQVVKVTSSGLSIQNIVADSAWGRIAGLHLASKPWYVENQTNYSHAAPVYALPAYRETEYRMVNGEQPVAADEPRKSKKRSARKKVKKSRRSKNRRVSKGRRARA